jgi:hypothetical protein
MALRRHRALLKYGDIVTLKGLVTTLSLILWTFPDRTGPDPAQIP